MSENICGFSLWLTREQWGFVLDGLIEHAATLRRRKSVNSASTADETVTQVEEIIRSIGDLADIPVRFIAASIEPDQGDSKTTRDQRDLALKKLGEEINKNSDAIRYIRRKLRWVEENTPEETYLTTTIYILEGRLVPIYPAEGTEEPYDRH